MASDYAELTKEQLQAELSERGLPVSGNKSELIERLEQDDTQSKVPPEDQDQAEASEDQGDAGDADQDEAADTDVDEDQGDAEDAGVAIGTVEPDDETPPPLRAGGWIDRRDGRGWVPEED